MQIYATGSREVDLHAKDPYVWGKLSAEVNTVKDNSRNMRDICIDKTDCRDAATGAVPERGQTVRRSGTPASTGRNFANTGRTAHERQNCGKTIAGGDESEL